MLIALASGKGAPGTSVTAAALAAAWPRPALLVEADPRGGNFLWGWGQGATAEGRGLLGFEVSSRRMDPLEALSQQVVQLDQQWPDTFVLPGLDDARQAATIDWNGLAALLASQDQWDVIADCGTVPGVRAPSAIWSAADLTVLVTRATMAAAHFAESSAQVLRGDLQAHGLGIDRLVSIVVGAGRPYSLGEMEAFLAELAPAEGEINWDPDVAAAFSDGRDIASRRMRRSGLLRSAAKLVERLGGLAVQNRRATHVVTPAPAESVAERGAVAASAAPVGSAVGPVRAAQGRRQVLHADVRLPPRAPATPPGPNRGSS